MIHKNFDHFDNFGIKNGKLESYNLESPFAVNTFKLDLYTPDWDILDIYFFEAFIVFSLKYGNGFYYQHKRLCNDLNLTDYRVRKLKKVCLSKGYISKKRQSSKGNFKSIFTVNYDEIIQRIDEIYDFEILPADVRTRFRNHYIDLFKYYKNKSFKKKPEEREISSPEIKNMIDQTYQGIIQDFAEETDEEELC